MHPNKTTKQRKRVSGKYHLTLFTQSVFKGLPVLPMSEGLVGNYLARLLSVIQSALRKHNRVFAARVDLHFPLWYHAHEGQVLGNEYLHYFIESLETKLQAYSERKQRSGVRIHSVEFDYVWAREYNKDNTKPHFHLLLLFNGHAFNSLGCFSSNYVSLYNRIGESWADVLGLHGSEGIKFVHFPADGQYRVQSGNQAQLARLFLRTSYLAKVISKNFHDGCHVFGGSRVSNHGVAVDEAGV